MANRANTRTTRLRFGFISNKVRFLVSLLRPQFARVAPYFGNMNANYSCGQCGMSVKAQCAKCDVPLENDHLDLPDGSSVQVSRCPSCEGKIKSPLCCGTDMTCSA